MLGLETPEKKVKISRKTLIGVALVLVIIVLAGVTIYLLGSPAPKTVKIVRFFPADETSHLTIGIHIEGDQMVFPFYVKVENSGSNNVSNLLVVVRVFGDYSELGNNTARIETLKAGSRKTMSMVVRIKTSELQGKIINYVATVYQGNTVLDEAIGEV
jgi:hypothetical protein